MCVLTYLFNQFVVLVHTHPILPSNEVQLVYDEEVHILDILALLPPAGEHVPVLWCAHYHIPLCAVNILHHHDIAWFTVVYCSLL